MRAQEKGFWVNPTSYLLCSRLGLHCVNLAKDIFYQPKICRRFAALSGKWASIERPPAPPGHKQPRHSKGHIGCKQLAMPIPPSTTTPPTHARQFVKLSICWVPCNQNVWNMAASPHIMEAMVRTLFSDPWLGFPTISVPAFVAWTMRMAIAF